MMRVRDVVERSITDLLVAPVVIASGQRQDVLTDSTGKNAPHAWSNKEIAYIEIFNAALPGSGNNVYYKFGADADNITNFNAYIQPGQMLEIKTRERVSVFNPNVGAVTISITVLERNYSTDQNR